MRIYTATPMPFLPAHVPAEEFFCRDMGLTTHALKASGVESKSVLLHVDGALPHADIIRASLDEMKSPAFWSGLRVDAVVLGAWAAPRYTPIARAIKASGAGLFVRCDNGGSFSQWHKSPTRSAREHYLYARYAGRGALSALAIATIKTPLFYIPALYDRRVVEHMAYADLILNETPDGVRGLKAFLSRVGQGEVAARVLYAPHPVDMPDTETMMPKQRRILCVGRWSNYSKNAPLCMRVLARVIENDPRYEAHLIGPGEDVLHALRNRLPASIRSRMIIHGKMPNADVRMACAQARIFFAPSRSESFNIAAAEALSEGCTLVGGSHIYAYRHFVSRNSGTLARRYSARGLTKALRMEINAWEYGLRGSDAVRDAWRNEFAASTLAKTLIHFATNQLVQQGDHNVPVS